jgi:hypothetical protein
MYNKRNSLFETLSIWIECSKKRSLCKLFIDKFPQMCYQTLSNPRKISLELFAWYINSFSLLKVFVCGSSTLSGQMIVRWCLLKDWCLLCIFRNAPGYSTHCVDLKTSNVHSKRANTRFSVSITVLASKLTKGRAVSRQLSLWLLTQWHTV